jgi:hypothetical protein
MNLSEIEQRVAGINSPTAVEFLYELLSAYGIPKASISRLRSGTYDKADREDERLWKGKVWFRGTNCGDDELYALIDSAKTEERVTKERPRFLIVMNDSRMLAADTETGGTLDIGVDELTGNVAFFLPWAGIEKTQLDNLNYADVKAAEKMAKLYDEVTKHDANTFETEEEIHALNVFFSRLLFCFFAEDTGVFEHTSFTNAISSLTRENGEDTHAFLDELFTVLDTDPAERKGLPSHQQAFGYVNGNLFAKRSAAPHFSAKARALILECGTLDWSEINPDIFGSMIQAVVHPSHREGLGMHYTSVENIMKVIRPLFLDDLEEAFEKADTVKKLDRLLTRISEIQIFDPACGSGNFLVISYKELRRLEHRVLQRITELEPARMGLFKLSALKLENFYGIEIDDFAHEIAILSLWLAKHQMNTEFEELFGAEIPLIPLRDAGSIVNGNATRISWSAVCDPDSAAQTYILGNPPYLGSSRQKPEQKADFVDYFGTGHYPKNLDYISLWFFKGADYVAGSQKASLAFVSTNSISQGEQVPLLWPRVLDSGVRIVFAYESFRWTNQARGNAGVTCVIVGLSQAAPSGSGFLYSAAGVREVENINPYLRAGSSDLIVLPSRRPPSGLPPMLFGSKPADGGFLSLSREEKDRLIQADPRAEEFVKDFMGASELLNGKERYCLWITNEQAQAAMSLPPVRRLTDQVAAFRERSNKAATRQLAEVPYRFAEARHAGTSAVIVPIHSSENRDYIPMGFVDESTVISSAANAIYGAEPWLFGLVQSRMHMAWVRAVAGALESRIRYSAVLVYNTFPVPELTDEAKANVASGAVGILGAREQFSDSTLAELYDPDKMPGGLRKAHQELDQIVDSLYRAKPFDSDEERLELLFEMYEAAIAEEEPSNV